MSVAVLPVTKAVYICDDVLEDPKKRKIHLVGVHNALSPKDAVPYPHTPKLLCVFAQMVGGVGELSGHVEIVNAQTEQVIYTFARQRLQFPAKHTTVSACFRIRNCTFPQAGVYFVELYCQDVFLDDRVLYLLDVGASA